jgi:hypothetical protein
MWRTSILAARHKRSAAICEDDPIPADAKVRAPGLALAGEDVILSVRIENPRDEEHVAEIFQQHGAVQIWAQNRPYTRRAPRFGLPNVS